jgi:hypothetical protein
MPGEDLLTAKAMPATKTTAAAPAPTQAPGV